MGRPASHYAMPKPAHPATNANQTAAVANTDEAKPAGKSCATAIWEAVFGKATAKEAKPGTEFLLSNTDGPK